MCKRFEDVIEKHGVDMQCVYGPNFDIECIGILRLALKNKIKLYRIDLDKFESKELGEDRTTGALRTKEAHFRVIDGMQVSTDRDMHPQFRQYDGGFWFNNIHLGREKEDVFKKLKTKSRYLSPEDVKKMIINAKEIPVEDVGKKEGFIKHDKGGNPVPAKDLDIKKLQQILN